MTVWSAYLSYRMRVQSVTKVLVPHAVTLWKGGVGPGFQQFLTSYSEASSGATKCLRLSLGFAAIKLFYLPIHSRVADSSIMRVMIM